MNAFIIDDEIVYNEEGRYFEVETVAARYGGEGEKERMPRRLNQCH
jgi:hypothetical protein